MKYSIRTDALCTFHGHREFYILSLQMFLSFPLFSYGTIIVIVYKFFFFFFTFHAIQSNTREKIFIKERYFISIN